MFFLEVMRITNEKWKKAVKGFNFVRQHKLERAFYFLGASQKIKSILVLSA